MLSVICIELVNSMALSHFPVGCLIFISIYSSLCIDAIVCAYINSTESANFTTPAAVVIPGENSENGSLSTGLIVLYVFLGIIGSIFALICLCIGCTCLCKMCGNCEDAEVNASCDCCGDVVWKKSY